MNKRTLILVFGLVLATGLSFCKKEEAKVEEAPAAIEDAAKAAVSDAEAKAKAVANEAVKKAETEVKKQAAAGADAAKDAINAKKPSF
ncbi:hypothetical protein LPTSP3_g19650 [Leptospira kobayashii]|uniref:Lipoprotein n=1 Tax=Leptospira kobayashii TaxID=1917830 RepID=A0ABM7UJZ3_9LEPT|nr:hypothetical protein [Leptospira kobayashii]BDA79035.1 hypothetical protein LPTSP3_g19650 [Leptospira kobayashii]